MSLMALETRWKKDLTAIMEELNESEFKKMLFHLVKIPQGVKADKVRVELPQLIIQYYGAESSISMIEKLMKEIPRMDAAVQEKLRPHVDKLKKQRQKIKEMAKTVANSGSVAKKEKPVANSGSVAKKEKPVANSGPVAKKEKPVAYSGPVAKKEKPVAYSGPVAKKEKPVADSGSVAKKEKPAAGTKSKPAAASGPVANKTKPAADAQKSSQPDQKKTITNPKGSSKTTAAKVVKESAQSTIKTKKEPGPAAAAKPKQKKTEK